MSFYFTNFIFWMSALSISKNRFWNLDCASSITYIQRKSLSKRNIGPTIPYSLTFILYELAHTKNTFEFVILRFISIINVEYISIEVYELFWLQEQWTFFKLNYSTEKRFCESRVRVWVENNKNVFLFQQHIHDLVFTRLYVSLFWGLTCFMSHVLPKKNIPNFELHFLCF